MTLQFQQNIKPKGGFSETSQDYNYWSGKTPLKRGGGEVGVCATKDSTRITHFPLLLLLRLSFLSFLHSFCFFLLLLILLFPPLLLLLLLL